MFDPLNKLAPHWHLTTKSLLTQVWLRIVFSSFVKLCAGFEWAPWPRPESLFSGRNQSEMNYRSLPTLRESEPPLTLTKNSRRAATRCPFLLCLVCVAPGSCRPRWVRKNVCVISFLQSAIWTRKPSASNGARKRNQRHPVCHFRLIPTQADWPTIHRWLAVCCKL